MIENKEKKTFHTIAEVSKIFDENQHTLRFWERSFPILKPMHSSTYRRYYREKDLQIIKVIKSLLRDDLYSMAGAKKQLGKRFRF